MHLRTSSTSGTQFSVDSSLSRLMFDAIPELCSDLSHGLSGIERSKVASVPLVVGAASKMQKHNLQELIEFNEKEFSPKVLINQPGYRLALLNLRAGQSVPEHAAKEMVTVYAISGHITFYENQTLVDLRAGEVLWIAGGVSHRLDAHEDSSLLVVRAGKAPTKEEELDLREIPHPQRHPLVFAKFDQLAVGDSFVLVNDHDPVPLNRQMEAKRPGQLAWEYITRGPDIFSIRVRRIAPLIGSETSPAVPTSTVARIRPA